MSTVALGPWRFDDTQGGASFWGSQGRVSMMAPTGLSPRPRRPLRTMITWELTAGAGTPPSTVGARPLKVQRREQGWPGLGGSCDLDPTPDPPGAASGKALLHPEKKPLLCSPPRPYDNDEPFTPEKAVCGLQGHKPGSARGPQGTQSPPAVSVSDVPSAHSSGCAHGGDCPAVPSPANALQEVPSACRGQSAGRRVWSVWVRTSD